MSDLSDVIEQVRELGDLMANDAVPGAQSYLDRLGFILADLEALRDWPEDHGEPHIGVPGPEYDADHKD